jgi:hypothetical protein
LIDDARNKCAHRRAGDRGPGAMPRRLAPTLVVGVTDMAIMREEIFGPLLPVETYRRRTTRSPGSTRARTARCTGSAGPPPPCARTARDHLAGA